MSIAPRRNLPVVSEASLRLSARRVSASQLSLILAVVALVAVLSYQLVLGGRLLARAGLFSAEPGREAAVLHATTLGAVGFACAVIPRRFVHWLAVGCWCITVVVIVVVGVGAGVWWSQIVALATLGGFWAAGRGLLATAWLRGAGVSNEPAVSLALGFTIGSLLLFGLGLASVLRPVIVLPMVLVGAVVAVRGALTLAPNALRGLELPRNRVRTFGAAAVATVTAFAAIWAAAPEIQYDAVYAKVWLRQVWAWNGQITFPVEHPVLAMFGTGYVAPVAGHLSGAPAVGRWMQFFLALGLTWILARWTNRLLPALTAVIAVGFALTPHVIWQMSTANDDLMLTLLVVGLVIAVLHEVGVGAQPRAMSLVVGLLAGGALAGKMHLAAFAVTVALGWLVLAPAGQRWATTLVTSVGALVTGAPILIARWIATGNPVFPQLNNVFLSAHYPPVNATFNFPYLDDGSLASLLKLPLTMISSPSEVMEAVPPGVFGVLVAPLILGPLVALTGPRRGRVVAVASIVAYALWWNQLRYLRYLLPYAAVGLMLLPYVAGHAGVVAGRRWNAVSAICISVTAVALFPSTLAAFWNIPERLPWRVAVGVETAADYRTRTLPARSLSEVVNSWAEPGDLVVGEAYVRQDLDRGIDSSPAWEFDERRMLGPPLASADPVEVLSRWHDLGADFLAVYTSLRLQRQYSPEMLMLLDSRAELLWARQGMELWRLVDAPPAERPVLPCDAELLGRPGCWGGVLDNTPGLEASEVPSGIRSYVTPCPGVTYTVRVQTAGIDGSTTLYIVGWDARGVPGAYAQHAVAVGENALIGLTVPDRVTRLEFTIQAAGGARVKRVDLGATASSPNCVESSP
jgi:hypothetical protein